VHLVIISKPVNIHTFANYISFHLQVKDLNNLRCIIKDKSDSKNAQVLKLNHKLAMQNH